MKKRKVPCNKNCVCLLHVRSRIVVQLTHLSRSPDELIVERTRSMSHTLYYSNTSVEVSDSVSCHLH